MSGLGGECRNRNPCVIVACIMCIRKDIKHHMLLLYSKVHLKQFEIFAVIKNTTKNEIHNENTVRAKLCCRITNNPFERNGSNFHSLGEALPTGPPFPPPPLWMRISLLGQDLLGEERWPTSQRRRTKSLFLNGLLLGSFCTEIQVKLINHCQAVRIKQ